MMLTKVLMFIAVGAALGGAFGYFGKCTSGTCPLTSTPWRGGLYGAFIGLMIGLSSPRTSTTAGTSGTEGDSSLLHVESFDQFHSEVLMANGPVLVDFYADWCGPCRMLSPKLEDLADRYGDQIKVVKVNVDRAKGLAKEYKVQSIPDLRLFEGGRQTDQMVGAPNESQLRDFARVKNTAAVENSTM
jgi:thioredoxin 1